MNAIPQRRISDRSERQLIAPSIIKHNTRLAEAGSWTHESLAALGWTELSTEGVNVLMLAPENMRLLPDFDGAYELPIPDPTLEKMTPGPRESRVIHQDKPGDHVYTKKTSLVGDGIWTVADFIGHHWFGLMIIVLFIAALAVRS